MIYTDDILRGASSNVSYETLKLYSEEYDTNNYVLNQIQFFLIFCQQAHFEAKNRNKRGLSIPELHTRL